MANQSKIFIAKEGIPKFSSVKALDEWYLRQKCLMLGLPIKRGSYGLPYGYTYDPRERDKIIPIQEHLIAILDAKSYLSRCSSREVAKWLSATCGRKISHTGLLKLLATRCPDKCIRTLSLAEREALCYKI